VFISAFVLQISFAQQLLKQSKLTTLNESFLLLPPILQRKKKQTKQNFPTFYTFPHDPTNSTNPKNEARFLVSL
jgi:hypothetical protein